MVDQHDQTERQPSSEDGTKLGLAAAVELAMAAWRECDPPGYAEQPEQLDLLPAPLEGSEETGPKSAEREAETQELEIEGLRMRLASNAQD